MTFEMPEKDDYARGLDEVCADNEIALFSYQSVTSTMDVARRHQQELLPHKWGMVVAQTQTAGRGRSGRPWSSPEGGFWATIFLGTTRRADELSGLSLVIGCALARAAAQCGATVKLKWPNDIFTEEGAKIGGVLVETSSNGSGGTNILVGTGINLAVVPTGVAEASSLLKRYGAGVLPSQFGSLYVPEVRRCIKSFLKAGFSQFRYEWLRSAFKLHQPIEVSRLNGENTGLFAGITDQGELLLETVTGVRVVASGEVSCI